MVVPAQAGHRQTTENTVKTEIVEDKRHLETVCAKRQVRVRFLGELGGYEIATNAEEAQKLYETATARGHYLIARVEEENATLSIGAPITEETLKAFGVRSGTETAH